MKKMYLLTLFFHLGLLCLQANALGNETDRIALLKFKETITGDTNKILDSWNSSLHFCNWFGIRCSPRHQRVASIELEGHNLVGSISPYIGNLSFLRFVHLRNNTLHGQIPPQIGNLFRLQRFNAVNNSLTGEIPVNLSQCSQLKVIGLQGNNLTGEIPSEFASLQKLEHLLLGKNNLEGEIPASFGNLSSLITFHVIFNNLVGYIPDSIGRLTHLQTLYFGVNQLSGTIPMSIFNISSLVNFGVVQNHFNGSLPESIGFTLPNLEFLGFGENDFFGSIPSSLANASKLQKIDLGWNNFSGQVPSNLGNLKNLWWIRLHGNSLGSNSSTDLDFVTSLTNCTKLKILDFCLNNLGGALPNSVANLSTELSVFYFSNNQITGTIPAGLENLINLVGLVMNFNRITGVLPEYIGKLQKLQVFDVTSNRFSGQIPSSLSNLTRVSGLFLSMNRFEGTIPTGIGKLINLNTLAISYNELTGAIPVEICSLVSLSKAVDLSYNSLTGNLPSEIGKLSSLSSLDISGNNLSGEISPTIGDCFSLESLFLQDNSFHGSIPSSFTSLKNLHYLDLSRNNLTGLIPEALGSFKYLENLNLSFNDLEGKVPTGGIFKNASAFSLAKNSKLCGGIPELNLPKCPEKERKKWKSLKFKLAVVIPCFGVLVILAIVVLLFLKRNSKPKLSTASFPMMNQLFMRVSYRDLFQATDKFSAANLIGSGNFGTVYRGFLKNQERPVAIKVLKLDQNGALKSFISECKVLQNIRHRNLVKMLTSCSSEDNKGNEFKALVFEYMGNGSLETWLHPEVSSESQQRNLNFLQRINVGIDVASALHYLHDLCKTPIIHCDLKPSNVLLDDSLVARVCDFGLARMLSNANTMSQTTGIKGTIGYAATEYGVGSTVSIEGDMYSFGILLLEMFTGRRPTDEMLEDGLNLHEFVKKALPDRVMEVVDQRFFVGYDRIPVEQDENFLTWFRSTVENYTVSVLTVGLACSVESPKGRTAIKDVVQELSLIRDSFLDEIRQIN